MRFRKLRIGWSVVCGIACVLLIVLWVRSYSGMDGCLFPWSNNKSLAIASLCGEVGVACFPKMNYIGISPNERFDSVHPYSQLNETAFPHFIPRYPPYPAKFRSFKIRDNWYVGVPYRFLVLATAIISCASWVQWRKRFSLRTLLIAMTLVALVLGLAVYAARK
jgi:hypothetical protein